MITEVAKTFVGVDPVVSPIPVRPAVHYTTGGILCNGFTETPLKGLYAAGECSSVGIHGANRLGSNSLSEIVVFGKVAGERAAQYAQGIAAGGTDSACEPAAGMGVVATVTRPPRSAGRRTSTRRPRAG